MRDPVARFVSRYNFNREIYLRAQSKKILRQGRNRYKLWTIVWVHPSIQGSNRSISCYFIFFFTKHDSHSTLLPRSSNLATCVEKEEGVNEESHWTTYFFIFLGECAYSGELPRWHSLYKLARFKICVSVYFLVFLGQAWSCLCFCIFTSPDLN